MHERPKRRLHLTDAQAPNYKFEDLFLISFSLRLIFNNSTFIHTLCKEKSYCVGLGPVRQFEHVFLREILKSSVVDEVTFALTKNIFYKPEHMGE